jgi:hypothetical protein
METVRIRNPGMYWDIAANIHLPANFDRVGSVLVGTG